MSDYRNCYFYKLKCIVCLIILNVFLIIEICFMWLFLYYFINFDFFKFVVYVISLIICLNFYKYRFWNIFYDFDKRVIIGKNMDIVCVSIGNI